MERLDKFLCDSGAGTRSQVKAILKSGRVTVDGKPEKDPSKKVDIGTQTVCLDGEPLTGKRRMVVMLNKPAGFVTATEDASERTVMELLPEQWRHLDLKPVGRLDKATEGLLLFTNDGALTQRLLHPSHQVDKVYIVSVSGADEGSAGRLRAVTSLDGQPIAPAQVDELYRRGDRAEYRIVIHQGKKRQIRRMCAAVGLTVTRLCRIAEGGLELGALPPGRWRYLTAGELESIKGSD